MEQTERVTERKKRRESLVFAGLAILSWAPALLFMAASVWDTLLLAAVQLFGPLFMPPLVLFIFWQTTPAAWRESEAPAVKKAFRRHHFAEGSTALVIGVLDLALLFWYGDPWLRENTNFIWVVIGLYAAYAACLVAARRTKHLLQQAVETADVTSPAGS